MKGEEGKIKKHRKRKGRVNWLKRSLAVCLAAATLMTGVGLESVFADEAVSTGKVETQQSAQTEVQTQAETGEADENTAAANAADPADHNNDPESVTTGGEAADSQQKQTADSDSGQTSNESQSTDSKAEAAIQGSEKNTADGTDAAGTNAADSAADMSDTAGTELPETIPVEQLKANLKAFQAQSTSVQQEEQIQVWQYYREERDYLLSTQSAGFAGGMMDNSNVPKSLYGNGVPRKYGHAELVYSSGTDYENAVEITGLYPGPVDGSNPVQWYYVLKDGDQSRDTGDYGEVSVGHKLPETKGNETDGTPAEVEIRFFYTTESSKSHTVTVNFGGIQDKNQSSRTDWNISVNGQSPTVNNLPSAMPITNVPDGKVVPFSFTLPARYEYAEIEVKTVSVSDNNKETTTVYTTKEGEDHSLERSADARSYSGYFVTLDGPTIVNFKGYLYNSDARLYFAAYSDMAMDSGAWDPVSNPQTRGGSRVYTKSGNVAGGTSTPTYDLKIDDVNGQRWDYDNLGYGMGSYSGGGEPYVMGDWQTRAVYQGSGSSYSHASKFVRANKGWTGSTEGLEIDTSYTENSGLTPGNGSKVSVVRDQGTGQKDTVPVGQYTPGSEVAFQFDTISNNPSGSGGYSFVPTALSIDIYTSNAAFSTGDFARQTFILPSGNNQSITKNLEMGGKITITCTSWQQQETEPFNANHTLTDDEMNNFTLKVGDSHAYARTPSGSTWNQSWVRWYSYEVKVQGCAYPFKLFQTHASGAQTGAVLTEANGIELGTGNQASASNTDIKNSYIWKRPSAGQGPLYYPLTIPYAVYGYNIHNSGTENNSVQLGLKPKIGYTKPKVISNSNKITSTPTNGAGTSSPLGEAGRYTYSLKIAGDQDLFNQPGTFRINAEPIEVQVLYNDKNSNGGRKEGVKMGYGGNQAVLNTVLTSFGNIPTGQYFNGFTLTMKKGNSDTATLKITNPNSQTGQDKNVWHLGDLVNFDELYSQMEKIFLDEDTVKYTLEIVPQYARTPGADSLIDGKFTIQRQTGFNNGTTYQDDAFNEKSEYTLKAVNGSEVVAVGYKEQLELNSRTYVFGKSSKTEGKVSATDPFAKLYYLYGVSVKIDSSGINDVLTSGGSAGTEAQNAIDAFNAANADRYYTSISGEDNVIDYTDVYQKLEAVDSNNFSGFAAKVGSTTYNSLLLPEKTGVDLYKLYGGNSVETNNPYSDNYRDIWNALFTASQTDGVLTLVPVYASLRIDQDGETSYNKETYTGGNADMDVNNGSVTLSADFRFNGNAADLLAGGVSFAVVKDTKTPDSTTGIMTDNVKATEAVAYGTLKSDASGGITTENTGGSYWNNKLTLDLTKGVAINNGTISLPFTINSIDESGKPSIRYEEDEKADYKIYVWSAGNASAAQINLADGISDTERNLLTGGSSDIPGDTNQLKVLPKAVSTIEEQKVPGGEAIQQIESPDPIVTNAEKDFDVTGSFQADPWYPVDLQIGNSAASEAKVHIALYKKNPDSNPPDWHSWAFDGDLTSGAGVAGSTEQKTNKGRIDFGGDGEATVTFPIFNRINPTNGNPTVSWQWDDRAKYCIVAWNESNKDLAGDNPTFTKNNLCPGGAQSDEAPSVTSEIQLQWQESNYYVYIPANVILTEDEANVSGGSEGYAGAAATIRYKNPSSGNPAEGNNEKDQPEVEVKVEADKAMTEEATGNKTMTMGIYGTDGTKRQITQESPDPIAGTTGNYAWVGVLKNAGDSTETTADTKESVTTGKSISYQINAKTNNGDARGTSYTGTVEYILTLRDYVRPTS